MSQSAAITAGRAAGREKAGDAKQLPKGVGDNLTKVGMGLAVVGVGAAGAGYVMDPKRFAFSYFVGFLVVATSES